MGAHLQRGDHFVAVVLGGDGIPHDAVGVDDRVPLLPADDDGPLSPRRAVELLGVALDGDGGVGVGGDHGRDWGGEEAQEVPVRAREASPQRRGPAPRCPSPQSTSCPARGSSNSWGRVQKTPLPVPFSPAHPRLGQPLSSPGVLIFHGPLFRIF